MSEPNHVYVDASYDNGVAGLAMTGALGDRAMCVPANSSTHAEVMAMRWAVDFAHRVGLTDAVFFTDSSCAVRQQYKGKADVRWVPRRKTLKVDALSRHARLGYLDLRSAYA